MTEPVAVKGRAGSHWQSALRFVVSAVLLAVLVSRAPDLGDIVPDRHPALTAALLLLALVVTFVGVVLSAWRWQRVLLLFDEHVPLRTLTAHYLVGLFVGNVLPSTVGGDVVRVARASGSVSSSSVSFASVVLERLTGFIALPLLVLVGFAIRPSLLDHSNAWLALVVAGATLTLLAIVLFLAGHPRVAGRFADHENWMRFIGAVHRGIDRLRREPHQILPALGTALVYQASVVMMFGLIFRALDVPLPIAGVIAFTPAVLMIQVLPISPSGLGVREGALWLFLGSFLQAHDITKSRAVAAGLLWYGCMLVISMFGAPAFAMGHRRGARVPVEIAPGEDEP
jgi:hypothetical protein